MAINKIQISKIFALPTEPSKATLNRFWYDTTNKILKHYDGTSWVPLQVHADDVVVLPNGDTKSLTECLSIIGDGLDSLETSKQNKLLYYSETSGAAPSATISVTNINLRGKVAQGGGTTASGQYSHAEGVATTASGDYSHAEGGSTTASGSYSHTEGIGTTASGNASHAEGQYTTASSDRQHAQGKFNIEDVNDKYADIIGNGTTPADRSNAATVSWDGISWSQTDVRAGGTDQDAATHSLSAKQNATDNSLETTDKTIVGAINELSADKQDTLQFYTESITDAPGYPSGSGIYKEQISLGKNNYSQTINIGGSNNLQNINLGGSVGTYGIITIGTTGNNNQIQIGRDNTNTTLEINAATLNGNAIDKTALTESSNKLPTSQAVLNELSSKQDKLLYYSETSGAAPSATISVANIKLDGKVAEGTGTTASGQGSHAEGSRTTASGPYSHAEGSRTTASGNYSHAEGGSTTASGHFSHTEGLRTTASGSYSHSEGSNTTASSEYQHAQGKFNIEDVNDKYADIIGNGTSPSARSNAATVSWDGISWSQSDVRAGGTDQDAATHSLSAKQNATDNNLTTTDKTIVGAINEIENKVLDSHLSKLPYGTLYLDKGKLSGSNFAVPTFPFSICATVRIDAWRGVSENSQPIFQYGELGSSSTCAIAFIGGENDPKLRLRIVDKIEETNKSTDITCALNLSNFLGKMHTIVGICRAVTSDALNWDIYIDGVKQSVASSVKNLVVSSLSGTRNWAVNTSNDNFSSQPASANPMRLRNLCVFNFDISAEDAPYSIADYEAGRLIPPSLIGNQFTGMYGGGWSVSGDTATCSGTSTESYPRITGGEIPSGFNFSFTIDVELAFSGTPKFEVYTNCQKAHAEIYDYSTQLTTQKDSAPGGGFYANSSLGITASGHYKIKFDCESSLGGKGTIQMACSALSSGTIVLSNTYYSRCNLALENYTIARNATTKLVKDASGNSNDATVTGGVAGDNDQSIKVFVDEIKTQINQSNG